jgi:bacillopeptidase F
MIFIGVIVIGYSLFSARHIIKGPTIVIETPQNGELTKNNFVEIKGKSENLNYITLNDRQIFIDDEGNFKEKLILYDGENTLKLYGKDKFGRETTKYIQVVAPGDEAPVLTLKDEDKTTATSSPKISKLKKL